MMGRALELARQAAGEGEVPVGAVVYETATGRVLGEGRNAREASGDPAGHAELLAVRAAAQALGSWRLTGCTLVVTLEPCPMCAGLVVNARVDRLVYGAPDPKAGACGSLLRLTEDARLNHRVTPIAGVEREACAEVLRAFFRARRAERRGDGVTTGDADPATDGTPAPGPDVPPTGATLSPAPAVNAEGAALRTFLATHDAPCPACGYGLRALPADRCPECGTQLALGVAAPRLRLAPWVVAMVGIALAAGFCGVITLLLIVAGIVNLVIDPTVRPPLEAIVIFSSLAGATAIDATLLFLLYRRNTLWLRQPPSRQWWMTAAVWGGTFLAHALLGAMIAVR